MSFLFLTTIQFEYGYVLARTLDEIRPGYQFDITSQGTVPEALICALELKDFEDAVRNAISLGGDADTLAAIAGGVAEALFGIPERWAKEGRSRLPGDMNVVLDELYERTAHDRSS